MENIELCDQYREQRLEEQFMKVKEALAKKQEEIEGRSAYVINQRIKEELVMLRQWTENLMRQKINEEINKLRLFTQREIKSTRELLQVPGIVGIGNLIAGDGDENIPSSERARSKPQYQDFKEFAIAQMREGEVNLKEHKRLEKKTDNVVSMVKEGQRICKTK